MNGPHFPEEPPGSSPDESEVSRHDGQGEQPGGAVGSGTPIETDAPEEPDASVETDAPEEPDTPVETDAPEQADAAAERGASAEGERRTAPEPREQPRERSRRAGSRRRRERRGSRPGSSDDMPPAAEGPLVHVAFRGGRRETFHNTKGLEIRPGDYVLVEAERGSDLGSVVTCEGPRIRRRRSQPVRALLRHAAKEEVARMSVLEQEDREAHEICRSRAAHFRLQMKVIDAETQFDSNRVTFYFTADRRVDFRELVRDLARTFRTRIELRQIGARDAARRCDGIGPCGRRLCCTGFLTEFEPVTLKMAKQQNLALNPAKISGSCGRLMCCLTYEVRAYQEALRKAPLVGSAWRFRDAVWTVDRLDIGNHRLLLKDSEGCPEPVDLDEFRSQATPEAPSTEAADSAPNVGRTPPGKSLDGPSE